MGGMDFEQLTKNLLLSARTDKTLLVICAGLIAGILYPVLPLLFREDLRSVLLIIAQHRVVGRLMMLLIGIAMIASGQLIVLSLVR